MISNLTTLSSDSFWSFYGPCLGLTPLAQPACFCFFDSEQLEKGNQAIHCKALNNLELSSCTDIMFKTCGLEWNRDDMELFNIDDKSD